LQALQESREAGCHSASLPAKLISTPIDISAQSAACAASGHVAAAPPSSVMNSRRFTA
jgi:hypothetical protein